MSQTQSDQSSEHQSSNTSDEKKVGTESYHSLLSVIQHNSGGPQHPMCDVSQARLIFAGYKGEGVETFNKALRMAKQNGDLVEWVDNGEWTGGNSRTRIGITLDGIDKTEAGSYPLTPEDKPCIERIRDLEVANEPIDSDVVGWVEQHRIEIETRFDKDKQDPTDEGDASEQGVDGQDEITEGGNQS